MIAKKYRVFFWSVIFAFFSCTTVHSFSVVNTLKWLKQRFVGRPVTRSLAMDGISQEVTIPTSIAPHTTREILFTNNMPEFFEALKDDPRYADLPSFIDNTIVVNGKSLTPGSSAYITIENNRGIMTINLHKGFAKLIYAMEKGWLKGMLMRLLKHIEPSIQWQYNVPFSINDDIDSVQLSDLVLAAYNKSLDENAVNHRFQWFLIVDLSLNETVDL